MTEQFQQVRHIDDNGAATQTTRAVSDDTVTEQGSASIAARVVWYIAGVIITLLALRFVFVLLGANPNNGFVDFIYSVSYPFAAPFFGMFGYSTHYGVSRFEASTLVAIAIYALIAWGIARLITIRQPQ
jgi:hypothetical protein